MNLYGVLKLFTSPNKARLITHFWDCHCDNARCVTDLQKLLGINQSNLSKHIARLLKDKVIVYERINRERYYAINQDFRQRWDKIITPLTEAPENSPYMCSTCAAERHQAMPIASHVIAKNKHRGHNS